MVSNFLSNFFEDEADDCDFVSNNVEWEKLEKLGGTNSQPCGEACFLNPNCYYWVYNQKNRMCYLKKGPPMKAIKSLGKVCGIVPDRIKR